ncbi:MAG: hypothetical protein Q9227_003348 [Pyrenula ochraceoflavens]
MILPTFILQCKDKKWLKQEQKADDAWFEEVYQGYNVDMVDDIAEWGFDVEDVVAVLQQLGFRRRRGQYRYLTEDKWEELDENLSGQAALKAKFTTEQVIAALQEFAYGPQDDDLNDEELDDVVASLLEKAYATTRDYARTQAIRDNEDIPLQIGYHSAHYP